MRVTVERARVFKYANFDASALCRLASELRRGQPCLCDPSQVPTSGSLNWTIIVSFSDGVEWVLRSPRDDGAIQSDETNLILLASEAATLKYLGVHSTIPVPKVFAYSCSRDNDIGIPYILMSKANGSPLRCTWKSPGACGPGPSPIQKAKVMFQLGGIIWQLSRLRFDRIGSIFEENGGFRIKSCLSQGLLMNERYSLEELHRGPFVSENEYYDALISAFLQQARCLPLSHHCFFAPVPAQSEYSDSSQYQRAASRWSDFVTLGSKIDGSDNRSDYIIAGEALSEMLSKWVHKISRFHEDDRRNRFPIHHPDINVNNLFIDDEYNITCVIDWAFCSSVPLSVLLTPPGLPQSRNEVEPSLLLMFKCGFLNAHHENSLQKDLKKDVGIYQLLKQSRPMWLFSRLLNFDSIKDYDLFKDLWDSIGSDDPDVQDMSELFISKQSLEQYKALRDELKEEDAPPRQVALSERQYFREDVWGLAISRKLTLASEWSSRYGKPRARGIRRNGSIFVADKKLWLWIEKCLNSD